MDVGTTVSAALIAAAEYAAIGLGSWLGLLVVLDLVGRAGGGMAGAAGRAVDLLAPIAVRRVVDAVVGLGLVVLGGGALSTAAAETKAPQPAGEDGAGPFERPADGVAWLVPGATTRAPASPPARVPSVLPASREVVVVGGDTLWDIAAARLPAPTNRRIARAWPRWWQANRDVVGENPHLIFPGQRLTPPTPQGSTQ